MDNQPHGLQTGQSVVFKEVNGMVELNGTVRQVSGIIFQVSLNIHVFMKCLAYFRFLKFDHSLIYYILSQFFLLYSKLLKLIH